MPTLNLISATVRHDGREVRCIWKSAGEPPKYGYPDRALSMGMPTISNGAGLYPKGAIIRQGEFQPIDLNSGYTNTSGTGGGSLPLGTYQFCFAITDGSGNFVGQNHQAGFTISNPTEKPIVISPGPHAFPPGYVARLFMSTTNGNRSTMRLYKTFTFRSTPGTVTGNNLSGRTFADIPGGGIPMDVYAWQDPTAQPPPYTGFCWIVDYWITSQANIIQLGDSVTMSFPLASLKDRFGNLSAAVNAFALTNDSVVDSDGFGSPALTASATDNKYFSSSHGSDSTGDGSQGNPWASHEKALSYLNVHYPNGTPGNVVMNYLRGDTFAYQTQSGLNASGSSLQAPIVFQSYWNLAYGTDPAVRPIVNCATAAGGSCNPFGLATVQNIVIQGIRFVDTETPVASAAPGQFVWGGKCISTVNAPKNIICIDCDIAQFGYGASFQAASSANAATANAFDYCRNISFIRTKFIDGHGQGVFFDVTHHTLVSQCLFERCGWLDGNGFGGDFTQASIFDHGIYANHGQDPLSVWGCFISRVAGDGMQIRPGGTMYGCMFSTNYNHLLISGLGGAITGCGFNKTHDGQGVTGGNVLIRNMAGGGIGQHTSYVAYGHESSSNVFANGEVGTTQVQASALSVGVTLHCDFVDVIHRDNIVTGCGMSEVVQFPTGVTTTGLFQSFGNVFDSGTQPTIKLFSLPANWSWYQSDRHLSIGPAPTALVGATSYAFPTAFATLTGGDEATTTTLATGTYVNNAADLGSYYTSIGGPGGATDVDFFNYLRARPWNTWDSTYEAPPAVAYFRSQYSQASHSTAFARDGVTGFGQLLLGFWAAPPDDPTKLHAAIDACGFAATVYGTGCTWQGQVGTVGQSQFTLTVDGTTTSLTEVSGFNKTLFSGLADGPHTVYLVSHIQGGFSPNAVFVPAASTLTVTGSFPQIYSAPNYGPQSALIPSGAFGKVGYAIAPSLGYPGTDTLQGPATKYPATVIGNCIGPPAPISPVSSPILIAFNAKTDSIGIPNQSCYFGPAAGSATRQWPIGTLLRGDTEVWRGFLTPQIISQWQEPVCWIRGLDASDFADWRLYLAGSCDSVTNGGIPNAIAPTILLGAGGVWGSRPPRRRPVALWLGDSRTDCVSCGDGQCDKTRGWQYHLSQYLGADMLVHAKSGAVFFDHTPAGILNIAGAAPFMVPNLFDWIGVDLGTNFSDWATNYGSSNATYTAAYVAFVNNQLKPLLTPTGKAIIIVPNSGGGISITTPASDGARNLLWCIRQAYYTSFVNDRRVIFADISMVEGTTTTSSYSDCLNIVGSGGHQSNSGHRKQADRVWKQILPQLRK